MLRLAVCFVAALVVAVNLFAAMSMALAQGPCDVLAVSPETLRDGQLFYSLSGGRPWQPFSSFQSINAPRATVIHFVYVVREFQNEGRRYGALVIKSGRRLSGDEADVNRNAKRVALVRTEMSFRNSEKSNCDKSPPFSGGSVTAKAYDDYHDFGYVTRQNIANVKTLDSFHTQYETAKNECHATNDPTRDSLFDRRSNRSQYSFGEGIVSGGMYYQISVANFRQAYAQYRGDENTQGSSTGLTQQRVETRRYTTNDDGLSCVKIDILVSGLGNFIRINDLEARDRYSGTRQSERNEGFWSQIGR